MTCVATTHSVYMLTTWVDFLVTASTVRPYHAHLLMIPESNAGLVECRYPSLFPQGAGARAGSFAHTPHTDTAHMGYERLAF